MNKRLEGKVALITGGGTGIGASIARRFVSSGASVTITGRRMEPLSEIAGELDCLAVRGDTADEDDCAAAVAQTVARFGGLDILVANAGIVSAAGSVTTLDVTDWQGVTERKRDGCDADSQGGRPCHDGQRRRRHRDHFLRCRDPLNNGSCRLHNEQACPHGSDEDPGL